jgi:hypothetical protein
MTLKNFRIAAATLIVFNVIGTVVTWTQHLVKPGTSNAHAILNGTEFTGPLLFIALWTVFVSMTLTASRVRSAGAILMTLFALIYTIGNTAELFKRNVGLSSNKWHFVLAAAGFGLVISVTTVILGIGYLVKSRTASVG